MILDRYILREHIPPFVFGLSLIIFIFVMNLLFQMLGRIAGKGIPVGVIVEFFALNLAWILALAVPMAVLIAALSAFGRMAADGEITAIRASGVSPARLVRPAMFGALIITLLIGLFNNFLLPDLNHRTKLLQADISRKRPTFNIEPGIFNFDIQNYVMKAEGVNSETSMLRDVTIYDEKKASERSVITADNGFIQFSQAEEKFLLTLYDGEIHRPSPRGEDQYEWTQFDSAVFRVPAPGMLLKRDETGYRGDRELKIPEMLERVAKLKEKDDSEYNRKRIAAYMVEVHKKFTIPIACLVFVLLGAPLGIMARKGGVAVSGGLSLLFFVIYWAFLMSGEKLADRGLLSPAVSMWMPNVLLTIVGVWLLWLAKRRTTLPGGTFVGSLWKRFTKQDRDLVLKDTE